MIRILFRCRPLQSIFLRLLLLVVVGLAGGCSSGEDSKANNGKPTKPPVPVSVAVAVQKAVPVELHAVGQVEASTQVTVRSQVPGVISAVHFHEGDEVHKGDLLFSLDPTLFQSTLTKTKANLEQARAEAANARRDAERYARLLAADYVSREEADAAQSRAESLSAVLAAVQASVENARIQLDYCSIRAPQGGRTGALLVHPGTVVKANDAPDLVTINTLRPVRVVFNIPERSLPVLRRQLAIGPLTVTALPPGDDRPMESGTISFLDNSVDPATGTIRLKASFANRELRLWPGQYAEVTIVLETLDAALVVPTAALQTGQQGSYLFVVDTDQSVSSRPVTSGVSWKDLTVINRGLEPGETVVTAGQLRLSPGAKVNVKSTGGIPPEAPAI
jgi:membrane fusion protein, multidrug efflux system